MVARDEGAVWQPDGKTFAFQFRLKPLEPVAFGRSHRAVENYGVFHCFVQSLYPSSNALHFSRKIPPVT